jgi:hypothetical protein
VANRPQVPTGNVPGDPDNREIGRLLLHGAFVAWRRANVQQGR